MQPLRTLVSKPRAPTLSASPKLRGSCMLWPATGGTLPCLHPLLVRLQHPHCTPR